LTAAGLGGPDCADSDRWRERLRNLESNAPIREVEMKIKELKDKADLIAKNNQGSVKELAELVSALADIVVKVANTDAGAVRRAKIEKRQMDL
jgi:hypothetical protein